MQEIECAVPLVLPSPIIAADSTNVQHHDIEANLNGMLPELHNERLALEQEVANLKEKLLHEIKLREALKGGLQRSPGTLLKIPGYVPAKTRELLFEVAVLEEEVVFLEKHAIYLRQELQGDIKPESSSSLRLDGGEVTDSVSKKSIASETKIPESEVSEPTTPNNPLTPSLTPYETPEWRPSGVSSPSAMHDNNTPLSSSVPSDFALPLSMNSPPPHADKSDSIPPQILNRKRVIRRGFSSSESVPADSSEAHDVDRKPSRKKPNHKKSQSLPCVARKTDVECDANITRTDPVSKEAERDVYERLSAPKKGVHARSSARPSILANSDKSRNAALKWSANGKEVQRLCRTPPRPATSQDERVDNRVKKSARKKELPGRSPPRTSPHIETKKSPSLRRSSSLREMETECSLASTPSPVFEDKAIASIKRIVSNMSPTGSPQLKVRNCSNSPTTPTAEQGNQDRLVTPFKLPATLEKENVKVLTPSDERRRTHDLVITRSLPPIKLNMASKLHSPVKGAVQHRLTVSNNFSENAKLYAKTKLLSTPTKQDFKVRPLEVQKPSCTGDDFEQSTSKLVDDDDKDDKVDMACGPIADASWLPDDLAKLFGIVCSKIRRQSSDPPATKMVAKPLVPPLGNSQRVSSFGRSRSFDIRSQGGLQLLEEYCSDGMNLLDSYDVRKHRSANIGPHRHYYKAIKPPLEQKLKA